MGNDIPQDCLTKKTAVVINNDSAGHSAREIKRAVKEELQRLLLNGEITEEQAKNAKKFLDRDLSSALARRNSVEAHTLIENLYDEKADRLMKSAGLTVSDLYDASKLAGADYKVNYTKLSKAEKEMAANGEITPSELKNIKNALNEKIKAKGGDIELSDKETKRLMKALGLSVEKKFNISRILLAAIGLGEIGGVAGLATSTGAKTVTATAINVVDNVEVTATATTHVGARGIGLAGGLVAGAAIGAGAEMFRQANRKEKSFGEQGGVEGGKGSVTNKTEAKMHKVNTLASETGAIEKENVQPQEEDLPLSPMPVEIPDPPLYPEEE